MMEKMDESPEKTSKKMIAEAHRYLLEFGGKSVSDGSYCTVVVEMTYEGGNPTLLTKFTRETQRPQQIAS